MSSLAELAELIGFFSYARQDDIDSLGALSDLRDRIYRELSMQLGRDQRDFRLWQDKAAIPYGTLWKDEITRAVQESAFFIPIVSPRSVRSEHCRFEFDAFLERETELGRKNLVFPILYIEVPGLEREESWRANDILRIVNDRQFADWRAIRHLDVGSVEMKRRIEGFCQHIVEALEWTGARPKTSAPSRAPPGRDRAVGAMSPNAAFIEDVTPSKMGGSDGSRGSADPARQPQRPSEPHVKVRSRYLLPAAATGLACLCVGLVAALLFKAGPPAGPTMPGVEEKAPTISPSPQRPVIPIVPHTPAPRSVGVDGGFPIDVGDTAADVQRVYGTSKSPVPMSGTSTEKTMIRLENLGIWFFFDSQGKIYTIRFDSPWPGSVRGIAIGDPKSKIEAVLGKPNGSDAPSHGMGPYYYEDRYVYRRNGVSISIYFLNAANRVETIMVP